MTREDVDRALIDGFLAGASLATIRSKDQDVRAALRYATILFFIDLKTKSLREQKRLRTSFETFYPHLEIPDYL